LRERNGLVSKLFDFKSQQGREMWQAKVTFEYLHGSSGALNSAYCYQLFFSHKRLICITFCAEWQKQKALG